MDEYGLVTNMLSNFLVSGFMRVVSFIVSSLISFKYTLAQAKLQNLTPHCFFVAWYNVLQVSQCRRAPFALHGLLQNLEELLVDKNVFPHARQCFSTVETVFIFGAEFDMIKITFAYSYQSHVS